MSVRSSSGVFAAIVAALFLSSCATGKNSAGTAKTQSNVGIGGSGSGSEGIKEVESFHLSDPEGPKVVDEELENIPSEVNPLVEKWIDYFKGKGRPHMEHYLARSTRYEKLMKKVLRDSGLPEDVFYIAMIESGFSSRAVSNASAVGYWQFIRGTGKRYGLQIDRFVDERRDPVLATQAAADYFKGLYSVFGSWYLAMASYNVGENRVKKEVMNHYTRDFWELAKKNRFPKETINYIPKFIAAKLIAKNPAAYGFADIDYLPPIEFDSIALNKPVNMRVMADKMNYNYEDFKALNPKFKGEIAPLSGNILDLRIPVGQKDAAIAAANESVVEKVEYIADTGDTQSYKIRRGDNLHTIARKFRTSVAYLRDLNDIPKGKRLRVGMAIAVPDRTPVSQRKGRTNVASNRSQSAVVEVAEGTSKFYIVQSGDSLFTIARRYNTTVDQLKRINNIQRGKTLKVGLKLKLPTSDTAGEGEIDQHEKKSTYTPESRHDRSVTKHAAARKPSSRMKKVVRHTVRPGENLHTIAQKYRVDVAAIKLQNKLKHPSKLFVGVQLIIPSAQAAN
jgi:membrane-bound lytic murein transglycosylase D